MRDGDGGVAAPGVSAPRRQCATAAGAGAAAAFFGVLVTVLGFVALSVTRRWNRQDARHPGAPPTSPPPAPGTLPG